jgi:RNA polymerase sigma-70 factor (ECF subfamily)
MPESPVTRASLLIRLRDARDKEAWNQFVQVYAPLIYSFARSRGLQDADAADLMQDVLSSLTRSLGRLDYDPQRGSFRSWLYTITRNRLNTFLDRQSRVVHGTGDSGAHRLLEQEPEPAEISEWERGYERRVFEWASERIHAGASESIWQAFYQTAVEGKKPKDVAKTLNMSVGAVYVAKSRILSQIREQVQQLNEA